MQDQKIVIVGFMGSGKTTVARALAFQLECPWVDLDELITKHESRSPKEIILQDGEAEFRTRETLMLRKVLTTGAERIIAAGGGVWTIPENRVLIASSGACSVWLDAPFEFCWKRLLVDGEGRPLARTQEEAHALYNERRPIYSEADVRIIVDEDQTPEDLARDIVVSLAECWKQPQDRRAT